jgi:hypothetical protein
MSILLISCLLFSSIGVNGSVGLAWPARETVPTFSINVHGHFLEWGFVEVGVDFWLFLYAHGYDLVHIEMEHAAMESYSVTAGPNITLGPFSLKCGAGISHHRFSASTWGQYVDYSDSDWGFHISGSIWFRPFWKMNLIMKHKYYWVDIGNDDPDFDTYSVTFGVAIN